MGKYTQYEHAEFKRPLFTDQTLYRQMKSITLSNPEMKNKKQEVKQSKTL